MFFRRAKPRTPTHEERLADLERAGFTVTAKASGETHIARGECAAELRLDGTIVRAGILAGGEIGVIVDGGNQKFLVTPSRRKLPALASHLKALHTFGEDLREGLGLPSLYNESLGTVNEFHQYDRVKGRE